MRKAGACVAEARTVQIWHRDFRKNECFRHLNIYVATGIKPEPYLFELFPEAKGRLLSFATANLSSFSLEKIKVYLDDTLFPSLLKQFNKDDGEQFDMTDFRTMLGMRSDTGVSISTVCRYLQQLGYSFEGRKKTFYVDGHERGNVVIDRVKFCKQYAKLELRCFRWVQVSEEQVKDMLKDEKLSLNEAYTYTDNDGNEMLEFHVDSARGALAEFIDGELGKRLGGNLSVRKPAGTKPIIMVGQDEAIFHQNATRRRQWILPDGSRELLPKTDGDAIMISLFVNREDGSPVLTQEILALINETRAGKHYADKEAATELLQSTLKQPLILEDNPFVQHFAVGVNYEGYWNYYQMALQFEDVVDCLKVLYPPEDYDLYFYFDHSSCHDKTLDDGLNAIQMNSECGGKQPPMRETKIIEGCLGKFPHPLLELGSMQSLVFKSTDQGPYYMTAADRLKRKEDSVTEKSKSRTLKKNELFAKLKEKGVPWPRRYIAKEELQQMCSSNSIEIQVTETVIQPGWNGKAKGLRQILWERGLLDPELKYTKQGPTDEDGNVDCSKSLTCLMRACPDFRNEKNALQHLGEQLGVVVLSTPKYHAELAGEGVEYMWALCKNWFKRQPLNKRKSRADFKKLVETAVSNEMITPKAVRGSARRARSYILAYLFLDHGSTEDSGIKQEFVDIEVSAKTYRSHRGPEDQQSGFIKKLYTEVYAEDLPLLEE
jgi:hypothetical protein